MLEAFSVENYRAFARCQVIDVRPLTLFFGWNSGGKSALLRFVPLLAESVRTDGPPIWLAGELGRGATWSDLVCKATERGNLKFSLKWEEQHRLAARWEVAGDVEGRWQETQSLTVTHESSEVTASRMETPDKKWHGLLPQDGENTTAILRSALGDFASEVQWISGVRVAPPRVATYGGGAPARLRADGRDAVLHLIAAQLQSTAAPLLEHTGSLFAALGDRLVLDNPAEGIWRVMLHPASAPHVRVNLCDTGEGYAQVLPVLVALARVHLGGPRLLCLEQPELHLHTRAQLELARLLVATATSPSRPKILVETHSEVLLMSVQLAIAKGDIAPEKVRVYWIETRSDGTSDAVPVDFTAEGRPVGSGLVGAFGEASSLGHELVSMQLRRARK